MAEDNVIPFPVQPAAEPPRASPTDPAELARQLLAAGHSPQDLLAAISAAGTAGFVPPRPTAPTLLARRDRVARYTIKVVLDGSKPRIWRRITVPSDLPLARLHDVLQAAMGWTDSHLHAFVTGSGQYGRRPRFLTAFDIDEGEEGVAEADVRLDEALGSAGDRLSYEYDFGDGWDHTLQVEAVDELAGGGSVQTQVTGGRRCCPPEDVGGIHAYNEVVAGLAGACTDNAWIQEKLDWLPAGFDPATFDPAEASSAAAAAAAGRAPWLELPFSHPELVEMLLALGPLSPLSELMAEAAEAAEGATELSHEEMAGAVRPLSILLDLVGADGVDLTAAGYLKPALVERLAQDTGITQTWIGKANREDLTPPVASLRATAQSIGLVRKYRQRLLLTRVGARARQDPQCLWDALVAALPAGKRPQERQAGLIALVATAAGRPRYPLTSSGEVLTGLGWLVDGAPVTDTIANDCARPTWRVIGALDPGRRRDLPPAAAVLARAALRPVSPV